MVEIRGIGISGQKATGIAYVCEKKNKQYHNAKYIDCDREKKRFFEVLVAAQKEVEAIFNEASKDDESAADIFMSHKLLLNDEDLNDYIIQLLNQGYDLLSALIRTEEDMKAHFLNMDNERFRSKVADIEDVFERLIKIETGDMDDLYYPKEPFILVCDDILPSMLYHYPIDYLKGFIVRFGSNCSHGAIIARMRNIPMIIRLKNRIDQIKRNDKLLMNGESGTIFILDE